MQNGSEDKKASEFPSSVSSYLGCHQKGPPTFRGQLTASNNQECPEDYVLVHSRCIQLIPKNSHYDFHGNTEAWEGQASPCFKLFYII